MADSPWAQVPRQAEMPQAPVVTPDQMYPTFPNMAGLGNQMGYDMPPEIIPVPAMAPMMGQMPMDADQISPWALMQAMGPQE